MGEPCPSLASLESHLPSLPPLSAFSASFTLKLDIQIYSEPGGCLLVEFGCANMVEKMGPTKEELSKKLVYPRYYCDLCRLLPDASYIQGSGCQFWSVELSFNKEYLFFWFVCFCCSLALSLELEFSSCQSPASSGQQHQEGKGSYLYQQNLESII